MFVGGRMDATATYSYITQEIVYAAAGILDTAYAFKHSTAGMSHLRHEIQVNKTFYYSGESR
jgi:hypothetical protein